MSDFVLLLAALGPQKCDAPSDSLIQVVLAKSPSDSPLIVFRLRDKARRKIAEFHPGFKPLLSLDDLHQARYTSGYVRNNLGMDDGSAQDIAGLPPECFANGEYIGYPSASTISRRTYCSRTGSTG